ncbi:phage major capsid protein [Bifidobacterium sp. ESL0790]|uniref:phage major capsid protein n=1 Tax=Bifidobacterium sp. ESL0790 TaxID=2983233 RepID=UPI0023F6EC0B|nr:phage major capsid protein [Bifidobacterium sp. ESL0790]WEV72145.1 phage major capsid protein [Bifidobacterium sp. ESL0790]
MNKKERLKALLAEAKTLEAKGESLTDEDIERAEKLTGEIDDLKKDIAKTEKTAALLKGAIKSEPKSKGDDGTEQAMKGMTLGQRFVNSPEMKAWHKSNPHGVDGQPVSIKARDLGSFQSVRKADPDPLSTGLAGAVQTTRLPGIDDLTYRNEPVFLNLITRGTTDSDHTDYRQLVKVTNNAGIVPEKSKKPLSTLEFRLATANGYTYADGFKVTNQELKDDGIISTLIDTTLRNNLDDKIEDIVLNGAGGTEPEGILHMTGTLAQSFVTDMVTTIRKGITSLQKTSKAKIQAIVLNPEDIESIDLLRDKNDRFLGQGPFGMGPRTLWGYPIVESQNVNQGTAIIGDFSVIQLLDYEGISVTAFNQNEDDARNNLTYIRAEQRSLMLCREPAKLLVANIKGGE